VWQSLYDELKDLGFMVFAVALDSRGSEIARPFIEAANTSYVSVIDREHRISDLYNMVNVPEAVWIDEEGRIVRPTETAGSGDFFRRMDLASRTLPEDAQREREATRARYFDALRDWVRNGPASAFAFDPEAARAHVPPLDDDKALAHCHFRLGLVLRETGRMAEAETAFAEASRLHPDSWSIWRQTGDIRHEGGPNPDFWGRVANLGERRYYGKIDMPGMP